MILLLDNYDSFTYNLLHYVEQLTEEPVTVKRNDEISVEDAGVYSSIILSPGPGLPSEAGVMNDIIREHSKRIPILGICLGLQAIGEVYGGTLTNLDNVLHGVKRETFITKPDDRLFKMLPHKIQSGHYHSWVLSKHLLPACLEITAVDEHGHIMAISHHEYPVSGVQFHPESVMTEYGLQIIENWLEFCHYK